MHLNSGLESFLKGFASVLKGRDVKGMPQEHRGKESLFHVNF